LAGDRAGDEQREADRGQHGGDHDGQHGAAGGRRALGGLGGGRGGVPAHLALELVVDDVQVREDRSDLVRVGGAGAVALLDAVDGLLARELDRLGRRGLEVAQGPVELGEGALALGALDVLGERHDGLARLGGEAVDLLRGAVLGLQVAVLDVQVADEEVGAGVEVLADGDEVLEPGDVALGEPAGVVVDGADALDADGGDDDQGEDEESERGAEPRGQAQVQEGLHAPGYRLARARLKWLTSCDHFQRVSSSAQSATPATRWPSGPV
jgi:hypothetical protein